MSGTVNHGYILSTTKRYREIIPDHIGVPVDPLVAGVVHRFAVGGWGGVRRGDGVRIDFPPRR